MNTLEKEPLKESLNSPTPTLTVVKQTSFISNYDPNISTSHTFRCIKKRQPWSEEEDKTIKQLVSKYGTSNWTLISSKMGKSRSGKQCRERWYNQLNPSIQKKNWTKEEENILFSKHMLLGNKWSDIGSYLPGRTLNDIKNHFYSKLRKFIRKILKQINDENLFEINGIDSCKYSGDKIYKMIKKNEITLKNLTKDTVFELIIATEKNPKGKLIFFNNNGRNNDIDNEINNNIGYVNDGSYEKYNNNYILNEKEGNIKNSLINANSNNYYELNIDVNDDNTCNNNIKLKLRKYSNFSDNISDTNFLNINNNNNNKNIKSKKKSKKIKNKTESNKENNIITSNNNNNKNINNNKILGQKRKKSTKKIISKKIEKNPNDIPELILSHETDPKKKIKKSSKKPPIEKHPSKTEINENNNSNNNIFNFYYPFNISSPKTIKNIPIPYSITKSNKSIKQEDFSFSKINSLNENYEPSLQKVSLRPINCENLILFPQKNVNYLMSDLSYENNLLKSRGSCYMNSKNDNTYNNFYNKILVQNNINNGANLSINKSLDEKYEKIKEDEKQPVIINIDLLNHQEFTNAFINGNNNIEANNDRSQFNNFIYNKNNNNLNIFNASSPPSVKSL